MTIDSSMIQFKDRANADSSVYPISIQKAIVDKPDGDDLTTYITEYNISLHQRNTTAGVGTPRRDTSIFTLSEAIAQVPEEYKHGGLKLTFNSDMLDVNSVRSYVLDSSVWNGNVKSWYEEGNNALVGYYTCTTGSSTAAKTVNDASGYVLSLGGSMKIRFTNKNTASSPTLNINGQGAKSIIYDGSTCSSTNTWADGETVECYYDGSVYQLNNVAGGGTFKTGQKVKNVGIDDEPTAGSENLVKSGGVYNINQTSNKNLLWQLAGSFCKSKIDFNSNSDGFITKPNGYKILYIKCKKDKLIRITGYNSAGIKIAYSSEIPTVNGSCSILRSFQTDCDVVINPDNDGYICVNLANYDGVSNYIYFYNIVDNSSTYIPHVKKFEYIQNAGIVVNSDLETYGSVQSDIGTTVLKCSADYIPIDGYSYIGTKIAYSSSSFTIVDNSTNFGICFYDNEYNVIDSMPTFIHTGDGHTHNSISLIKVPENSAYFKWTFYTSSDSVELILFDRANDGIHLDEALNLIKTEGVNYLGITSKVIDYTTQAGAILATGKFGASANYTHAVIPVTQGDIFFIVSNVSTIRFAFATSDESSLGGDIPMVEGTEVVVPPVNQYTKIIIPEGCNYLLYNDYAGKVFKYYENVDELGYLKHSDIENSLNSDDSDKVLSALQGKKLNDKVKEITLTEEKLPVIKTGDDKNIVDNYAITDEGVLIENSSYSYIRLEISGYDSIRFLNICKIAYNNSFGNRLGYRFLDENDNVIYTHNVLSNTELTTSTTVDSTIEIPNTAKYFECNIKVPAPSTLYDDFYAYGIKGNSILDICSQLSNVDIENRIDLPAILESGEGVTDNIVIDIRALTRNIISGYSEISLDIPANYRFLVTRSYIRNKFSSIALCNEQDNVIYITGNTTGATGYISNFIDLTQFPTAKTIKFTSSNTTINNKRSYVVFSNLKESYEKYFFGDKLFNEELKEDIENTIIQRVVSPSDILELNPENEYIQRFISMRRGIRHSVGGTSRVSSSSIIFGHISDCHGIGDETSNSHNNWERFLKFVNYWKNKGYLNDVVDTGDIVSSNHSEDISWRTNADNILTCIGNHDTANYEDGIPSSQVWQYYIGLPTYEKILAPNIQNWNVVQPDDASTLGKCYYYKDYTTDSGYNSNTNTATTLTLRAVFLDALGWGYSGFDSETQTFIEDDSQKTWLLNVLSDAKVNGYPVVIFTHYPPLLWGKIDCPYSSYSRTTNLGNTAIEQYNPKYKECGKLVRDFQVDGGVFLGYVCGHTHYDCIGICGGIETIDDTTIDFSSEKYPQLVFVVGKGNVQLGAKTMSEFEMVANTKNNDNFQIIAFNLYAKTVRLSKVGCEVDIHMRKKSPIEIDVSPIDSFDNTKVDYNNNAKVEKDGFIWKLIKPVVINNETSWESSVKEISSRINL